jgi:hypothetical protein
MTSTQIMVLKKKLILLYSSSIIYSIYKVTNSASHSEALQMIGKFTSSSYLERFKAAEDHQKTSQTPTKHMHKSQTPTSTPTSTPSSSSSRNATKLPVGGGSNPFDSNPLDMLMGLGVSSPAIVAPTLRSETPPFAHPFHTSMCTCMSFMRSNAHLHTHERLASRRLFQLHRLREVRHPSITTFNEHMIVIHALTHSLTHAFYMSAWRVIACVSCIDFAK